jgi:predicted dienelactone hydrolase
MVQHRAASLQALRRGAVACALKAAVLSVLLIASASPATAALNVTADERVFVDASRATPANGACPPEPDRTLRTRLWIPGGTCGGADPCPPYPLFVMAHGFGGLPEKFEAFATAIAQAGFVVAAPAFPLTNQNTPCGHLTGLGDVVEQPQDLTFVFGELLAANANAADALFGQIDPAALAVLGHSLGGVTAEGLAHSNCCTPPALAAALLVADPFGVASGLGWERVGTGPPTLVLHGQPDPIVPFDLAPDLFQSLPQPRYLVGLTDAGHSDLLESQVEPPIPPRAAAQSATIAFLNARARGDATALDTTLGQLAADGHLVFVNNAIPVPLLGDVGAWLLACLLLAGGASYIGRRRVRAG